MNWQHKLKKIYFQHLYLKKDVYPEYVKELFSKNSKKMNNPIRNWERDLNIHFKRR